MCRCISATALLLLYLVITLVYHLFPALAEYQPQVYSTLLFLRDVKSCCSEGEDGYEEFFDEEF
jgi:hypothetical protein